MLQGKTMVQTKLATEQHAKYNPVNVCVYVYVTHTEIHASKKAAECYGHTPDSSDPRGELDHWVFSHPTFRCTHFILCMHYFYNQRGANSGIIT